MSRLSDFSDASRDTLPYPTELTQVHHWRCSGCGQHRFTVDDQPPAAHKHCRDTPCTWDYLEAKRVTPQSGIVWWVCPNCGQHLFTSAGEAPPDLCDYCQDMTTWRQLE